MASLRAGHLRAKLGWNIKRVSYTHGPLRTPTRSIQTYANPAVSLRTGLYATLFVLSTGLFAVYYFDSRAVIHRHILTPILRRVLDAEVSHKFAVQAIRSGLAPRDPLPDDERVRAELWGQQLSNPIGLAAGFDKDGEAIDGLFDLGFSWVEIGSITPKPQPGNPKPRVFHLHNDSAMINRYGFPSQGHATVLARLRSRSCSDDLPASHRPGSLLAVNLGKNKTSPLDSVDDFVAGVQAFAPYVDVLVINVSSPNTPGLRGLQARQSLTNLLMELNHTRDGYVSSSGALRRPRLVLKIAPDLTLSDIVDVADAVKTNSIDGVIVSNTTVQRPPFLSDPNKFETGGLSGPPLKPYSLSVVRTLRTHLPASIAIIGCGGISTGQDALEYARAGASFVQLYTGFGYDGAGACRRIKDELAEELAKEGTTWAATVSKAVENLSEKTSPRHDGATSVAQLVAEGEELRALLDRLGERMVKEAETLVQIDSGTAAVPPTTA